MIKTFIEGIVLGLTIAILFGPAFFALLQTSIYRGFNSGVLLALGIIISDIGLIAICYLGVSQMVLSPEHKMYFGIIGGIILLIFGIVTFTRKPYSTEEGKSIDTDSPWAITYIFKGFFLNIANPFLIIFWMGAMSWVGSNLSLTSYDTLVFFAGTTITIFGTDLIKCYVAGKIKKFLTPSILLWMNRIVGITLAVFGMVLIFRVVYDSLNLSRLLH